MARDDRTVSTEIERSVLDYLSHLGVERGLAANTLTSYRRDLRRYLEHLASRGIDSVDKIGEPDVLAFMGVLRAGDAEHPPLSAASTARTVVAVRGFHKFLLRERLVTADASAAASVLRPACRCARARPTRAPVASFLLSALLMAFPTAFYLNISFRPPTCRPTCV